MTKCERNEIDRSLVRSNRFSFGVYGRRSVYTLCTTHIPSVSTACADVRMLCTLHVARVHFERRENPNEPVATQFYFAVSSSFILCARSSHALQFCHSLSLRGTHRESKLDCDIALHSKCVGCWRFCCHENSIDHSSYAKQQWVGGNVGAVRPFMHLWCNATYISYTKNQSIHIWTRDMDRPIPSNSTFQIVLVAKTKMCVTTREIRICVALKVRLTPQFLVIHWEFHSVCVFVFHCTTAIDFPSITRSHSHWISERREREGEQLVPIVWQRRRNEKEENEKKKIACNCW